VNGITNPALARWSNEGLTASLLDELDSREGLDLETLELHERARQGLSRTYSEEMES
jgi:hypothetical protein